MQVSVLASWWTRQRCDHGLNMNAVLAKSCCAVPCRVPFSKTVSGLSAKAERSSFQQCLVYSYLTHA